MRARFSTPRMPPPEGIIFLELYDSSATNNKNDKPISEIVFLRLTFQPTPANPSLAHGHTGLNILKDQLLASLGEDTKF
jgi:hypothetical protein